MCLITYKPADATLDLDKMRSAFNTNDDGWGIMAYDPDHSKLLIRKRPVAVVSERTAAWDSFVASYEELKDHDLGIHFRRRTHGGLNLNCTHPFEVLSQEQGDPIDLWLMHNGVITGYGGHGHTDDSDTGAYVKKVLSPIFRKYPGSWQDPMIIDLLCGHVGTGNKLLLFTSSGQHVIMNKGSGQQEGRVWYSNTYSFGGTTRVSRTYHGTRGHYDSATNRWVEDSAANPTSPPPPPTAYVPQQSQQEKNAVGGATTGAKNDNTNSTLGNEGGSPQGGAPFCPATSSNECATNTNTTNAASCAPEAGPILDGLARQASDKDIRQKYLDGDLDPRIKGVEFPIEALRYLTDDDLADLVYRNPDSVAELLAFLRDSYSFKLDDHAFRIKVLKHA